MTYLKPSDNTAKLASRAVKDVYPVSRLVREARVLLENSFPLLWVEGELSNLATPASGHIYFSLKDEAAQVRCAMFRNRNRQLRFTPENGMQVLLRVRVTLYEGRGEFQLVVEHMEEAGSGALQRAYEALKQRLGLEGLFDQAAKKTLPVLPATLGIISSPNGAAVHDIVSVLKRRFPAVRVILYPVTVQGKDAARQLVSALETAVERAECDVLIVGRGGGSLEDLWSFNDETLARTIFACPIPIISAVGHEIDFTIADFVADVRAPTPSAAAELAVADAAQLLGKIVGLGRRITSLIKASLHNEARQLRHLQHRLPKPDMRLGQQIQQLGRQQQRIAFAWSRQLQQRQQRLDYLLTRLKHPQAEINTQYARLQQLLRQLQQAFRQLQHKQHYHYRSLLSRFEQQNPQASIGQRQQLLAKLATQLDKAIRGVIDVYNQQLALQMRTLAAVSPLNTLERGYSITSEAKSGKVIVDAKSVEVGQAVQVRLHQGKLICEVKSVKDE